MSGPVRLKCVSEEITNEEMPVLRGGDPRRGDRVQTLQPRFEQQPLAHRAAGAEKEDQRCHVDRGDLLRSARPRLRRRVACWRRRRRQASGTHCTTSCSARNSIERESTATHHPSVTLSKWIHSCC